MVNSSKSIYQDLSDERKQLQSVGKLPQWYSTSAWQLLKEKYTTDKYPDLYSIYKRISSAASKHMDDEENSKYQRLHTD